MHLVSALSARPLYLLLRRWGSDRTGSMFVEFALLMPLVMGIMLALINLAIAHQIKLVAAMAVAEGARTAAVQFDPVDVLIQGEAAVIQYTGLFSTNVVCSDPATIIGFSDPVVDLDTTTGSGGNQVGALIRVTQEWCVINMFAGLLNLWGGGGGPLPTHIIGTVEAITTKEGW